MRKALVLIAICCLLCCCISNVKNLKTSNLNVTMPFKKFPKEYTCDGKDISPPIRIRGVNKNAKTLALIMVDVDAPKGIFVHWIAWNIPANVTYIPPGIPKKPVVKLMVQGRNDFGFIGYGGPCPPDHSVHRYVLKVYALDCRLNLKPGSSLNALYKAMNGHVLQEGSYTATYSR